MTARPATIGTHQVHGLRQGTWETNVSVHATTEVASRRGQVVVAVTSATANTGQA